MAHLVSGIGGIFFRAKDEKALSAWYAKHFGIPAVGGTELWIQEEGVTVFSPFKNTSTYFPVEQQFMINFRITDLDKFLEQLKAEGVQIDENRMDESYGKFAWVYDPEGNKIELWQPIDDSELT
jgi:predicted enzyme related to lactoylglutathione lyase